MGLRREELVRLDLTQLCPHTTDDLRRGHQARLSRVRGKGKTERSVFLSARTGWTEARARLQACLLVDTQHQLGGKERTRIEGDDRLDLLGKGRITRDF